jgi:hypothetical protein
VRGFLGLLRVLRNLGEAGLVRGRGIADANHNGMASYAEALQAKVAHAPVEPSRSEKEEIASRVAKNDMVEPELVAAVTNMGRHATFHPTMIVPGEQLPEGFVRSGSGFLVCTTPQEVQVNQSIVKRDTEHLQKHAVLAYFVGGRQRSMMMSQWVSALQAEVGAWVGIGRDLGKGFFQIYTKSLITTQKILMVEVGYVHFTDLDVGFHLQQTYRFEGAHLDHPKRSSRGIFRGCSGDSGRSGGTSWK